MAEKHSKEQEMQQKIVLYQLLNRHLEELKQQASLLESRFAEFESTKQALGDFREIKGSKDILVPLGSGCYAHGKAAESEGMLVNVGSNIMLKKPMKETIKLLEERTEEIQGMTKNLQEQMNSVIGQITSITGELEKMQQEK